MRCPRCNAGDFNPLQPCPKCEFQGEPAWLENLSQVRFLLAELEIWTGIPSNYRKALRQRYRDQEHQLEVELGLRPARLEGEALEAARQEQVIQNSLRQALIRWVHSRVVSPEAGRQVDQEIVVRLAELEQQLADTPKAAQQASPEQVLAAWQVQLTTLRGFHDRHQVLEQVAYQNAITQLDRDIARLSRRLGTAPLYVPLPAVTVAVPPAIGATTETAAEPAASATPAPAVSPRRVRQPLTWDRVVETLLSQRTLNALLFLGAGLLFAAAVSLVVWNWQAFPPWLQVTFLAVFTGIFYGLGWYVRNKMKLPGSGLALSAVASLLVPLDFYAFYLSGGFPPERWPEVWLLASIVCLGAYLLTTYRLQAEFFGYLVALAAGSLGASALQVAGVSLAWQGTAMCGVGVGLALAAASLARSPATSASRWRVLARPFWQVAILGSGVILALVLSRRLLGTPVDQVTRLAHAGDAWLCGLTFLLGALRLQRRPLIAAAALSFPLAIVLTQDVILARWEQSGAWHALGLAVLAPLYLWAGYRWRKAVAGSPGSLRDHAARIVLPIGGLLAAAAAVLALRQANTAAVVYPLLSATTALAAGLWLRPGWLYLSSLLLAVAASAGVAALDGSPPQTGLAWAGLAVAQIAAGVWLSRRTARQERASRAQSGNHFDTPLYVSGWLLGGAASAAVLVFNERGLLAYTLANWAGLNLWLAWLVHPLACGRPGETPLGLAAVVAQLRPRGSAGVRPRWHIPTTFFHFWASHLLIAAFYFAWTSRRPGDIYLALGLVGLAWLWLLTMAWAQRRAAQYQSPWHLAAQVAAGLGLLLTVLEYTDGWSALVLLALVVFYFAAAFLARRPSWLIAGGGLAPFAVLAGLDWLGLKFEAIYLAIAGLPLAYELWAAWMEPSHGDRSLWRPGPARLPAYQQALHRITRLAGAAILVVGLLAVPGSRLNDPLVLWVAGGVGLLALSLALHAWMENNRASTYVSAWLMALAGGLAAAHFGHGSGRSALLASLLAAAYILGERLVYAIAHRPALLLQKPGRAPVRRVVSAWRLFGRPLETTGWAMAALAIWLALIRNLFILGGPLRERWAAAALATLTGLFAAGVYLYRRRPQKALRLAWMASGLVIAPWSLAALQLWRAGRMPLAGYGLAWAILALLLLYIGFLIGSKRHTSLPPQYVAHVLLPLSALWSANNAGLTRATLSIALLFYASALAYDLRNGLRSPRFLYAWLLALPLWSLAMLYGAAPYAPTTLAGALLLLFPLPALLLGYRVGRRSELPAAYPVPIGSLLHMIAGPRFRLPLLCLAYGMLISGTLVMITEPAALAVALLFAAGLLALTAILFRNTVWVYLASAVFPMAVMVALSVLDAEIEYYGWSLLGCAGLYLAIAFLLDRWPYHSPGRPEATRETAGGQTGAGSPAATDRPAAAEGLTTPGHRPFAHQVSSALLAPILILTYVALPFTSLERAPAQVGYAAAAVLCALAAAWRRWPLLLLPAGGLALVPYWIGLLNLGMQPVDYGLGLWPAIAALLGLAYFLDFTAGTQRFASSELSSGWLRWWALPLFILAYTLAAGSVLLSVPYINRLPFALSLAALAYGMATAYFSSPAWLLIAAGMVQLAALAYLRWWGVTSGRMLPSLGGPYTFDTWLALAFAPVIWLTALGGLAVERRLGEGSPLPGGSLPPGASHTREQPNWIQADQKIGWSRPLYVLVLIDLLWAQIVGLGLAPESAAISLSNALLVGVLASAWRVGWLAYLSLALGAWALIQRLDWLRAPISDLAPNLALLAMGYGLAGYLIRLIRPTQSGMAAALVDNTQVKVSSTAENGLPGALRYLSLWERPLIRSGWALSLAALVFSLLTGLGVVRLAVRAVLGFPLLIPQDLPAVQRLVSVLALVGLFILAAAVVDRRLRLGYAAVALLLGAWSLELLLAWGLREVQFYAIPAGLYLLGVGYIERRTGSRSLARWIDYAAVLLLLGSSFWQSLGDAGERYALLMGVECLLLLWWGSARRMRRFLYAGAGGLTLNVATQLIEPLLSANRWIVFAVAGLLLVGLAVMIERRLETLKAFSEELRSRLEDWE